MITVVCITYGIACGCSDNDIASLETGFRNPPISARPGVYWYFMDGNFSKEAVTKDLESMKQVGIGHVLFLEVNVGVPRGTVDFLSEEWQELFAFAVHECERLGISVILGIGPGWTGSGGPWVKGAESMQHLVHTSTEVQGAGKQTFTLTKPLPKQPFFGMAQEVEQLWNDFYQDVAVLAFPSGATLFGSEYVDDGDYLDITELEERALYYRKPYSSLSYGVKEYLSTYDSYAARPDDKPVERNQVVDITPLMSTDGSITWDVPEGKWTVMRFGTRNNGNVTRPAPAPGLGLEADKLDTIALNSHLEQFTEKLFRRVGFTKARPDGGLQMLHIDSWEMGSQNWTPQFRNEFTRRRGYDPLPYYPAYAGVMVQSREVSERFLWDVRQTIQELILENHVGHVKRYAHRYGMSLSIEPYDMTPASDLELAAAADVPMCEFWSLNYGFNTSFSTGEGASAAHLLGQSVVPAESFTAQGDEAWKQHPASMKNEGEWAWASGINRFLYHTFAHQALPDSLRPGMTMGPYGIHWDRNQTWWPLSRAYHDYVSRSQFMLQQGRSVADILYLAPEGAPHVFRAPESAVEASDPMMPDRRGYNFDACPPSLLHKATVNNGHIRFAGGASYRLLVLPAFETMTPALLKKIAELVDQGATIVGLPPKKSPSLSGYPDCDVELQTLAQKLWGEVDTPSTLAVRPFGKGQIVWGETLKTNIDRLYPHYSVTEEILSDSIPPDFASTGDVRYAHRIDGDIDIYFVSNRAPQSIAPLCRFRVTGKQPELWHPVTGKISALPEYKVEKNLTSIPLKFDVHEGYFIVFRREARKTSRSSNFPTQKTIDTLDAAWAVSFDPKWGGPESTVFDNLHDWTVDPDPGIKYYSGTAIYQQTFDMPDTKTSGNLYLNLGKVKNIARVSLNGKDLGTVWTAPWQAEITGVVKSKNNTIKIEVTNLWSNRLIGDELLPYDGPEHGQWPEWMREGKPRTSGRYTFTTFRHYNQNSPLLESGLTGPVTLVEELWEATE